MSAWDDIQQTMADDQGWLTIDRKKKQVVDEHGNVMPSISERKDAEARATTPEEFNAASTLGPSPGMHAYMEKLRSLVGPDVARQQAFNTPAEAPAQNAPYKPMSAGEFSSSMIRGVSASLFKGILWPVSALIPTTYKRISDTVEEGVAAQRNFLNRPDVAPGMTPEQRDFWSKAPEFVTEQAGAILPLSASMTVGRTAVGLTPTAMKTLGVGGRILKKVEAAAVAGGVFSTFAKLEPGESKLAQVAESAAAFGAIETAAALWPKAVLAEMRDVSARKTALADANALKAFAESRGMTAEELVQKITEQRSGQGARDLDGAETTIETPGVQGTPAATMAGRTIEAHEAAGHKTPPVTDHLIGDDTVLQFNMSVDGKPVNSNGGLVRFTLPKDSPPEAIDDLFDKFRDQIHIPLMQNGANIELTNFVSASDYYTNKWRTKLYSKDLPKATGPVTAGAPKTSVAETGQAVAVDDKVYYKTPDGTIAEGTVAQVPGEPRRLTEAEAMARPVTGPNGEPVQPAPRVTRFVTAEAKAKLEAAPEPEVPAVGFTEKARTADPALLAEKTKLEAELADLTQRYPEAGGKPPTSKALGSATPAVEEMSPLKKGWSTEQRVAASHAKDLRNRIQVLEDRMNAVVPGAPEPEALHVTSSEEIDREIDAAFATQQGENEIAAAKRFIQEQNPKLYDSLLGNEHPSMWLTAARGLRAQLKAGHTLLVPEAKRLNSYQYWLDVKDPKTGRITRVPANSTEFTVQMRVTPGEVAPRLELKANSDGSPRSGMVFPQDNSFRIAAMDATDPAIEAMKEFTAGKSYSNNPMIFAHADGTLQVSIVPTRRVRVEPVYGGQANSGALDLVEAARVKRGLYGRQEQQGVGELLSPLPHVPGQVGGPEVVSTALARDITPREKVLFAWDQETHGGSRRIPRAKAEVLIQQYRDATGGTRVEAMRALMNEPRPQIGKRVVNRVEPTTAKTPGERPFLYGEGKPFPAGFNPRRTRFPEGTEAFLTEDVVPRADRAIPEDRLLTMDEVRKMGVEPAIATDEALSVHGLMRDPLDPTKIGLIPGNRGALDEIRANLRKGTKRLRTRRPLKSVEGLTTVEPEAGPIEYPQSRFLYPDELQGENPHPEFATLRQTARILIKNGVDENTPISAMLAKDLHAAVPSTPIMTLGQAADIKLPMPPWAELLDEAEMRGYSIEHMGKSVVLRAPDGNVWPPLEHLDALNKLRGEAYFPVDNSIEEDLNKWWNMGRRRGFDADVDSSRFRSVNMMDASNAKLWKGEASLVEMVTGDRPQFDKAMAALEEWNPLARKITTHTVRDLGTPVVKAKPIGELRTLPTEDVAAAGERLSSPKQHVVAFDRLQVDNIIAKYESQLNELGVTTRTGTVLLPAERIIDQLGTMEGGLDILKMGGQRDPESAIMYAWYRKKGDKEAWQMGKKVADDSGVYRVFDKEQKNAFTTKLCS